MLSSKSIKLRWSITFSPEREIIDGFFVGYRSFASQAQLAPTNQPNKLEQPTFTYKTIKLTSPQLVSDRQTDSSQTDSSLLSPVSSFTKSLLPAQRQQSDKTLQSTGQSQVVLVNQFEFVINGLERNTEYTILIQCYNKKGAGPTSDPVVFKTFANGEYLQLSLHLQSD